MNPLNVDLAITALLQLIAHANDLSQLINTAKTENRDITDAELDTVVNGYATAHENLDAAIQQARGGA